MAKECIICGTPTGSAEHLFPASFGGRRTDAGIYCAHHNKAFGRHVTVLLEALDFINARLGVVPDGEKEVRPSRALSHKGELYQLVGTKFEIAPPKGLNQTPELIGQLVELQFSSQSQADKWRRRQEKANFVFTNSSISKVRTTYFTRLPKVSITLVEKPFLRAAAYIALTYLGHYHPVIARMSGIACIKEVIAGEAPLGKRVWWESPKALTQLASCPFEWGHSVAISVDAGSKEVTALVSFFGDFVCGVLLGQIRDFESSLVVTHINPLALTRRGDISVVRQKTSTGLNHDRIAGAEYFASMLNRKLESPFEKVHRLMELKEDQELAVALHPRLISLRNSPPEEHFAQIFALLQPHGQRFLNALIKCLPTVIRQTDDEAAKSILILALEDDPNTENGLTSIGQTVLDGMMEIMSKYLSAHIQTEQLDEPAVAKLFGGKELQSLALSYLSILRDIWLQRPYP